MFWLGWRFADLGWACWGLCSKLCVELGSACVHSGAQTKGTAVTWGSCSMAMTRGQLETHSPLRSMLTSVIILLVKARYMTVKNQVNILCHFLKMGWKTTQQRVWTQEGWRIVVKNSLYYTLDWILADEHYLHKESLKYGRKLDSLCVSSQSQLMINVYKWRLRDRRHSV